MFISALKRQYWAYFLVVLSISLTSVFTRGFTKPLALGIAVELFMLFSVSFLLFCIGYFVMKLAKWCMRNFFGTSKLPKFLSILLILLLIGAVVPSNADAWFKPAVTFVAGVGFGAACSDLWNAGKEAVTEAVVAVVETIQEHAENSSYCSGCGKMVTGSHQCGQDYDYWSSGH